MLYIGRWVCCKSQSSGDVMSDVQDGFVVFGGAVKRLGDGRVGGVLVRFGSPDDTDLEGDFFTDGTDYGHFVKQGAEIPVFYNHGMDSTFDTEMIGAGKATVKADEGQIWFEAQLKVRKDYEKYVWQLIDEGKVGWSSGSADHLARWKMMGDAGMIRNWPIIEASITPFPAEFRNGVVPLKALKALKFTELVGVDQGGNAQEPGAGSATVSTDSGHVEVTINVNTEGTQKSAEKSKMADEPKQEPKVEPVVEPVAPKAPEIDYDLIATKVADRMKPAVDEPQDKPTFKTTANVADFSDIWMYDNLSTADLDFAVRVVADADSRRGPSERMLKALAIRIADEYEQGKRGFVENEAYKAMRQRGIPLSAKAIKANEVNYSTQSGYGDEWAGVFYSGDLWRSISQETPVVGRLPVIEVPQGSESVVIPIEGAPPTFYLVGQATAQDTNTLGRITLTATTSKQATSNQTLSVTKVGASTYWTGELDEDSVVPFASELRANITQEAMEVLEHLVVDGDSATGATTNINDIGGTPAGTEAFLALNGFRKLALVTNTANSRSAGALSVEDYLETLKLMGLGGRNVLARSGVAFIQDVWTGWKALELSEVKTRDVYAAPTVENGQLVSIWGRDVITSANMHRANTDTTYGLKANSSGKLDLDTAANNTTGAILAVRFDQWRFGFKRRLRFETRREPRADATEITAMMRIGLVYRDTEASAISYNITL